VIGPRVVPYSIVYEIVRITRALSSELPYGPVLPMLGIEKLDEAIERVTIGALWVPLRGARPGSSVSEWANDNERLWQHTLRLYCPSHSTGPSRLQDVWHEALPQSVLGGRPWLCESRSKRWMEYAVDNPHYYRRTNNQNTVSDAFSEGLIRVNAITSSFRFRCGNDVGVVQHTGALGP
jgi:hypothetical protein